MHVKTYVDSAALSPHPVLVYHPWGQQLVVIWLYWEGERGHADTNL